LGGGAQEFWGHNTSSYSGYGSFFVLETLVSSSLGNKTVAGSKIGLIFPALVLGYYFFSVVYRFSIFGRYSVDISWYLPNQYQRKTWLVHFGIIFLAGTPFFLKRGVLAPFLRGPAPILGKKGFPSNLKEFLPNSLVHKIPTGIPTNQYQYMVYQYRYQPSCQYQNGIQLKFFYCRKYDIPVPLLIE
jgi:hypothetical protein